MRTPKKSNNNLQRYYPTKQQMKWKISNKNKQFHASLGVPNEHTSVKAP